MRNVNEVIEILEEVKTSKIANKEYIAYYTNHLKEKTIEVCVELSSLDNEVIKTEYYTFSNADYLQNPSNENLWFLIDKKRES